MKLLVLFALVAGAFASEEECSANQHYNDCGTLCPVTCENYKNPPKACFLMCNPGCECDDGYVKAKDGSCVEPENCPVAGEKNCIDKPDVGMCRGNFPIWYYDEDARDCKEFVYGGCQGNGNRYGSRTECLKSCASIWESQSDRCSQPAETGLCKGYFPRFYFDKTSGKCKKFIYGGCGGNDNNFKKEEDCKKACGNQARRCGVNELYTECGTACPLTCDNKDKPPRICPAVCKIGCQCEKGYVRRGDGKCVKPNQCPNRKTHHAKVRNACEEDKEKGSCKGAFDRFYFNKHTGQCEAFIYGGCDGNSNNFLTLDDCEDVCIN